MPYECTGRSLDHGRPTRDLRAEHDALADEIQSRFGPLSAQHRALLDIILRHGGTFGQVATLRGEHASTVSRRFHRLLSNLSAAPGTSRRRPLDLSRLEKTILAEYFLCGQSQSDIAAKLSISRYRVRKTLSRVRKYTAAPQHMEAAS